MNRLYRSSRMEMLSETLAAKLKNTTGFVFSKTMIITQGGGMNAWLTTRLTEINSIFAHYEFQNQDGFMGQVYELLMGEKLKNNHDVIQYRVHRLLNSDEFKAYFRDVADYYEDNPLRRIQLSEKIADLFDQYQLYRPDMIKSWEHGQAMNPENESEQWQMWLWQQLNIPSKATLRDQIYQRLESDADKLKQCWPEIHLFGISIYTQFHLDFYKRLGDYIPVHFYVTLPSLEGKSQNSLLESFGSKAKELLEQFSGMTPESGSFSVVNTGTLLGRMQQSIINNEELTEKDNDDSLLVTSHYTPVREVESLYNYLLDLFEKDRERQLLKPQDVLVITPDINTYEPFIRAVFRNAPVKLPHRISGAAKNTGDSITASLELISHLGEEDLTAEKVLGLLEHNRIGRAYQVQDTTYVRAVVNKAGIRFGWENRMEDDTHYVSWKYGLEKFILGYAMLSMEALDGKYPYADAEASASYDLLRLNAFVDDLQELLDEQQKLRTMAAWKLFFLEKVMGKMVWSNDFENNDNEERKEIYRALAFTDYLDEDAATEEVPWEVFLNDLKKRLFTESRGQELNTGAITITSAIPVRGLPYKVIAFIGLNNGVFPRQDNHLGFDLMGDDYQVGDRSKKEADKSLFLDTLMAARQKLYLSYIGQSSKDNSEIPPSIVLDTLMDYLGLKSVKHPLHGFSAKYDNEKLFTYLYNSKSASAVFETKEKEAQSPDEPEEIWVADFVKFFEAPIDWYFKKVLGINYDGEEDDTLPDTELFDLDYLQKWQIKQELLKYEGSTKEELESFIQKHIKQGRLPLKNLGRATVEEILEEIQPVKGKYQALTKDKKEESVVIDLNIDGLRIAGTIDEVYGDEYITCNLSSSKSKEKHQIRAYLRSLLLFASGRIGGSIHIDNEGTETRLQAMHADAAVSKLESLVEFLKQGKDAPLKFTLKALKAKKENDPVTIDSILEQFRSEAEGSPNSRPPYPGNKYLQILMDECYFQGFSDEDRTKLKTLESLLNLNS